MKKKNPILKTKRLLLRPMSNEEIQKMIETAPDEEIKKEYQEMLSGCEADPENRIWYAPWKMTLKNEDTYIGDLGFKGPPVEKTVEIGYGVGKEYEGNGYTTEAAEAMIQWAYGNGAWFIEAETDADNKASQKILEKLGFEPDGEGEEGPRFVKEAEQARKNRAKRAV